jgi:quinol monooxygenase YgiN
MARVGALAKLTARAGAGAELRGLLEARAMVAQDEPGTELFIVHADPQLADAVWVYEVYADAQAERAHMATPGYAAASAALERLLGAEPEVYALVPVAGKGLVAREDA